jgi:hypothetical protein
VVAAALMFGGVGAVAFVTAIAASSIVVGEVEVEEREIEAHERRLAAVETQMANIERLLRNMSAGGPDHR